MNFMEKLTPDHKKELSEFIDGASRTAEEIKRAQAILLVSEKETQSLVKTLTGLKRETAVKARKKYLKGGLEAIASKRKGKKPRALLTKNQRAEISEMLKNKTPRNYGWDWDTWTPAILGSLILQLYAVKYKSKTPLYLLFKESKFSYHKPETVYEKRNQAVIDEWKETNKSIIEKALADSETVVLVEDEMILTSQTTTQKVWLPRNAVHKIVCSNTRKRRSIYGFLDLKTGTEIAFKEERQTSVITAKVLGKVLARYKGKKILLLWDNAPWHRGEAMKDFLTACTNSNVGLTILCFPTYAPEENPQEHVWKAARAAVTHNKFIPDIDVATRELLGMLNTSTFKYKFFDFTAQ
jgi:transposase